MSYWARQQTKVSVETSDIMGLIREGTPFKDWDLRLQKILSLATFPKDVSTSTGKWTVEGRNALNLLRHLIAGANFINAPEALKSPSLQMDEQESNEFALVAFFVRRELVLVTPPFSMNELISK